MVKMMVECNKVGHVIQEDRSNGTCGKDTHEFQR